MLFLALVPLKRLFPLSKIIYVHGPLKLPPTDAHLNARTKKTYHLSVKTNFWNRFSSVSPQYTVCTAIMHLAQYVTFGMPFLPTSRIRIHTLPNTEHILNIFGWMDECMNGLINELLCVYLKKKVEIFWHYILHPVALISLFSSQSFLESHSSHLSTSEPHAHLQWAPPHTSLVSLISCHWVSSTCTVELWPCFAARCRAAFPSCNTDTHPALVRRQWGSWEVSFG